MVIGNGLIASALSSFKTDDSVLIFASGVSNSKESDAHAYEREKSLLLAQQATNARLVYFSTCSVFDKSMGSSPYVIHKKEMEETVKRNFQNYLLIRLPILVGKTSNPNTFFNYIRDRIIKGESFFVHQNAWRNLFDVDDVKRFLKLYLKQNPMGKETMNVAFNNGASVMQLVGLFEDILSLKAKPQFINEGSKYEFDNKTFLSFMDENAIDYPKKNYNYNVLKKYLSK